MILIQPNKKKQKTQKNNYKFTAAFYRKNNIGERLKKAQSFSIHFFIEMIRILL